VQGSLSPPFFVSLCPHPLSKPRVLQMVPIVGSLCKTRTDERVFFLEWRTCLGPLIRLCRCLFSCAARLQETIVEISPPSLRVSPGFLFLPAELASSRALPFALKPGPARRSFSPVRAFQTVLATCLFSKQSPFLSPSGELLRIYQVCPFTGTRLSLLARIYFSAWSGPTPFRTFFVI